jgi:hypothetical protein
MHISCVGMMRSMLSMFVVPGGLPRNSRSKLILSVASASAENPPLKTYRQSEAEELYRAFRNFGESG